MTEINIENFENKFLEIKTCLEKAKFIAVDLEFSGLYPLKNQQPSLFDTSIERYDKLRRNLEQVIPLQIGLTAFEFDPARNNYNGTIYNFYVMPACFPTLDKTFCFQASSINFLKFYGFDVKKLFSLGIPYLNKNQETEFRERLKNNSISEIQSSFKSELLILYEIHDDTVQKWLQEVKVDDIMTIPEFTQYIKSKHYEILYFLHKHFRRKFKQIWTYIENDEFKLKKVSNEVYLQLEKSNNLDEEIVTNLLGFTKVFRLLTTLKKPLIGHNLFQDILLLINNFETPLPTSYNSFKTLVNNFFPTIFDTRTIAYEIKSLIPEEKMWRENKGLESLYEYFKNGAGRHLVLNSPQIDIVSEVEYGKFHDAGWDSFCSGYIFIRMAYLNVYQKYPKSKKFVSSELIGGLLELKNKINVIRGSVSFIQLDGEDPQSSRPPFLVIESIKKPSIDVHKVSVILSSFGFVEIKKIPYESRRALIAVDNFGSARRILSNFKTNSEFQVKQYSMLKHSPLIKSLVVSGMTISGLFVIWITHSFYKR